MGRRYSGGVWEAMSYSQELQEQLFIAFGRDDEDNMMTISVEDGRALITLGEQCNGVIGSMSLTKIQSRELANWLMYHTAEL
jgi:hypothetical protein